jgi:acyl-CoA thioesterase-2
MSDALQALINLLDLEPIEVNLFRGVQPGDARQRVFGGQVAGQALVAASRTVEEPGRNVHSLHAYFLRPGDPSVPIVYEVDRIRDGKSFTTRRVVAIQHGKAIFNLQASFHDPEPGNDFFQPAPTDLADPESLPNHQQRLAPYRDKIGDWFDKPRPIDIRYVPPDPLLDGDGPIDRQSVWMRADGVLPDDPVLHACIVTYASDFTLLDTAVRPSGLNWLMDDMMMASLDHAMWFHRPFRADEWMLYQQQAFSNTSARGLAGGSIYSADGRLIVNVVQEGLFRKAR